MKWLSIWMATAMAVFRAYGQTSQTTAVQVNSQAPTYLYGRQASKLEGDVKRRGGDNFAWKGSGAARSRRREVSECLQPGIHPNDDRHPQGVRRTLWGKDRRLLV